MSRFSLIAAVCKNNGIGFKNKIPWNNKDDLKFFRKKTLNQAIIMGHNTWKSLPIKPLNNRDNYIISKNFVVKSDDNSSVIGYDNFDQCIYDKRLQLYNNIYVIGGSKLYNYAINHPLCDTIYLNVIDNLYKCDKFFPSIDNNIWKISNMYTKNNVTYFKYSRDLPHNNTEHHYVDLVSKIIKFGNKKKDRTKIGTHSLFGNNIHFNIHDQFPLLSTKRVFFRGIFEELMWFLRGETNANILKAKNVHIWDGNTSREFLDKNRFYNRPLGDIGPGYGFQWRHFGAKYENMFSDYTGKGFDQIEYIIDLLKNNPNSRRIFMSAWNPVDISNMSLPPCHISYQFHVYNGFLSCSMYQRSGDVGLGVPFNIASASLLTYMLAHVCNLKPYELIYNIGDTHIYNNHIKPLKEQIRRIPRPFPKLLFNRNVNSIYDFKFSDIDLYGYYPHNKVNMVMTV